jgi:hypothetical protein
MAGEAGRGALGPRRAVDPLGRGGGHLRDRRTGLHAGDGLLSPGDDQSCILVMAVRRPSGGWDMRTRHQQLALTTSCEQPLR